jgi:7-cyano-7-deazaguanine synthase in queuosine biosynthesis
VVKDKEEDETLYVHYGQHNHALEVVEAQELVEALRVQATVAGESDRTLNAAKFVQMLAREKINEAMEQGMEFDVDK